MGRGAASRAGVGVGFENHEAAVCDGCGINAFECLLQGDGCCRVCACGARRFRANVEYLRAKFTAQSAELKAPRCECREPLYGRLCWNPGCSGSIHEELRLPAPRKDVIVTSGEAVS